MKPNDDLVIWRRGLVKRKQSGKKQQDEAKQAETELKKYDFLSWLAPYLRLKENTVNNLPNVNVPEINPNEDGMAEAAD